jgi:hypothetical protein
MGNIDYLTKKFPPADFRDPFTEWPEIMKKIESRFIIKESGDYHFSNWEENLKNKILIRKIPRETVFEEIQKLDVNTNYWIVIVTNKFPTSKHLVYDCKLNAISELISRFSVDFFIIDKKYHWLSFFYVDRITNEIVMFKSGEEMTPFDRNTSPLSP